MHCKAYLNNDITTTKAAFRNAEIQKKQHNGNFFSCRSLFSGIASGYASSTLSLTIPFNINETIASMSAHIYKKIEIVGSSQTSIEDAVNNAVAKASESIRHIRWVEIVETRCHVEDQKVAYWQVTVKIGFTLDEN